MIISCMNFTSAGEVGGNVALVDGVNVRVGLPGAPGCTTTGGGGSVCWAKTASENKPARWVATIIPLRNAATALTDRSLRFDLDDFIEVDGQTLSDLTLS